MRISDWSSDVCSSDLLREGRTNEASKVHGRADHRGAQGGRGGSQDSRSGQATRRVGSDDLQLEGQIWRPGGVRGEAFAPARGRERQAPRSEERRVGKEGSVRCRSCWLRYHKKKKTTVIC